MEPSLLDLLGRPAVFFHGADSRPSLVGPALVAATLGATVVVRLLLLVLDQLQAVATSIEGPPLVYAVGTFAVPAPRTILAASLAVGPLFFIGWFLATGVIYAVSRYYESGQSFRRLLAFVGWGQVPAVLPALVSTASVAAAVLTAPERTRGLLGRAGSR